MTAAEQKPSYPALGDLVQVNCDAAFSLDSTENKRAAVKVSGLWGKVLELKAADAIVQVSQEGSQRRSVPLEWLTRIETPPAKPASWKKNVFHLAAKTRDVIAAKWLPVALDGSITTKTLLSEAEVALGCVEIGWRVLPQRRCLVAPPHLCALVAHHLQDKNPVWEGSVLCTQLEAIASRAEILLMPILVEGHWTLLVVQRDSKCEGFMETEAVAPTPVASQSVGCTKCGDSKKGCIDCAEGPHLNWVNRTCHEDKLFDPVTHLAPLPAADGWHMRYYDSLSSAHGPCAEAALCLLQSLQTINVRIPMTTGEEIAKSRANSIRQDNGTACGFFVLHFVETEMRRASGEGHWPIIYDVDKRAQLLEAFCSRFK